MHPSLIGAQAPPRRRELRLGMIRPVEKDGGRADALKRARQSALADVLADEGLTRPLQSGSILEGIPRGVESFLRTRAARDEREAAEKRRLGRGDTLADALEAMQGDAPLPEGAEGPVRPGSPRRAASILAQNPDTAEMAFTLAMGDAQARRAREAEERRFQRQQQAQQEADERRFNQQRTLRGIPQATAPVPGRDVPFSPEVMQQRMNMALAQIQARQAAKGPALSVGQKKIDETAAKDLVPFVVGGGFADTQKGLEQLRKVEERLAEGGVTGTFVGLTPDFALAPFNQRAVDTQNLVEEVVQRNLRTILGAQFTEKEGQRLIARAYNPHLDEAANLRRVRALRQSIEQAARAKQEAWNHLQEHGTLKGFEGKIWGIQDFNRAIDSAGERSADVARETKPNSRGFKIERID